MNPLTNMKNVLKLSEQELKSQSKSSWHDMYRDSAWIFVGGLPYDLTEGDILAVFSQYGEIVNINLVRDKTSGKPKGFCFICYEDQRSTILAVDNFNGIKILNRILRVDHVHEYKVPKDDDKIDEETKRLRLEGCAPKLQIPVEDIKKEQSIQPIIKYEFDSPTRLPIGNIKSESIDIKIKKELKEKKSKKSKKKMTKKKKKVRKYSSNSSSDSDYTSDDEFEKKQKVSSKSKKKKKRKKNNQTQ